MSIVRTQLSGGHSAAPSTMGPAFARPRARWGAILRILVSTLILAVAGPLSIAHASVHVPFAGNAAADSTNDTVAEVSASNVDDGKQAPSAVQHQHCAVCPAASAIDVAVPQLSSRQALTTVTYNLPSIDDRAKFAPPPLRKPPRV